jgi:hypothetical protein
MKTKDQMTGAQIAYEMDLIFERYAKNANKIDPSYIAYIMFSITCAILLSSIGKEKLRELFEDILEKEDDLSK